MKSPAFLFYSKDWLIDTAEFEPAEKGVYIDLLAHQHVNGSLPVEIRKLAKLARLSEDEFISIWENIKFKFNQMDDRLVNHKLNQIIEQNNDRATKNKINGYFAVVIRQLKQPEKVIKEIKKSFDYKRFTEINESELKENINQWVNQMVDQMVNNIGNVNANVNEDVNIKGGTGGNEKKISIPEVSEKFEFFRKKFPGTKGGLKTELDNFLKKNNPETVNLLLPALEKEIAHKKHLKDVGEFCPEWKHMKTWINQKCWEQELSDVTSINSKYSKNGKQSINAMDPQDIGSPEAYEGTENYKY